MELSVTLKNLPLTSAEYSVGNILYALMLLRDISVCKASEKADDV